MKTMKSFATLAVVLALSVTSGVPVHAQIRQMFPDLVASYTFLTPELLRITIKNQGTVTAAPSVTLIRFYHKVSGWNFNPPSAWTPGGKCEDSSHQSGMDQTPQLDPGEARTITYDLTSTQCKVEVLLDIYGTVQESREANNQLMIYR